MYRETDENSGFWHMSKSFYRCVFIPPQIEPAATALMSNVTVGHTASHSIQWRHFFVYIFYIICRVLVAWSKTGRVSRWQTTHIMKKFNSLLRAARFVPTICYANLAKVFFTSSRRARNSTATNVVYPQFSSIVVVQWQKARSQANLEKTTPSAPSWVTMLRLYLDQSNCM